MHKVQSPLAVHVALKAAGVALSIPILRDYFVARLVQRLGKSHNECEDDGDMLMHDR